MIKTNHLKSFIILLFISAFQLHATPLTEKSINPEPQIAMLNEPTQPNTTTQEQKKLTPQQIKKLSAFIIALAIIASEPSLLIKTYLRTLCSLVCHELGHAITAKVLWGNPISIGLCASSKSQKEKPLYKNKYVTIESWYPSGGYTTISKPIEIDSTKTHRLTNGIITAAGPICGIIGHLLFSLLEAKISKKPFEFYQYGIANELLSNLLISDGKTNDAYYILEECFNKKTPAVVSALHPYSTLPILFISLESNKKKRRAQKNLKGRWQYMTASFTSKEKEFYLDLCLSLLNEENKTPTATETTPLHS